MSSRNGCKSGRQSENVSKRVVVAVTDCRLDFGTWEQIFYGEFDGRQKKRVLVKIIGD
ncbi:MAG: YjbQ family protein [Deltaproteobacteria bacterium]|nr:YjbQ family protein [Deltaproteobacteria bacterium]